MRKQNEAGGSPKIGSSPGELRSAENDRDHSGSENLRGFCSFALGLNGEIMLLETPNCTLYIHCRHFKSIHFLLIILRAEYCCSS